MKDYRPKYTFLAAKRRAAKIVPELSLYLGAEWYLKNQRGFNENNMY